MNLSKRDMLLHSTMCIIGGFMGCYTIMCRSENLGSAQTSNLIQIFTCLFGSNIFDFLLRLGGMGLYVFATVICVVLRKKTSCNMEKYAIAVDAAGLAALSLFPVNINPIIGILPIFFMMSTQLSVFHGIGDYSSSTIFSTNNLRQCITALSEYIINKEKPQKDKSIFFGNSLLWYHLGVIFGFFACKFCSIYGSLLCIPVVTIAFIFASYENAPNQKCKCTT